MNELVERFSQFVSTPEMRSAFAQLVYGQALVALQTGSNALSVAFELDLIADRLHAPSATQDLLREVAHALRAAALSTPEGARYTAKSRARDD